LPTCSSTWPSRERHAARAREIAEEIEDVGGEVNAATSTETTSYYARVLKDHVPLAVDILADILTESAFEEEELEREKQVILQEINAANDTPDDVVFDRFSESPIATRRSAAPFSARRRPSFPSPRSRSAAISAATTRPTACSWSRRRRQHDEFVRMVEDRFVAADGAERAACHGAGRYIGGNIRETRDLMDAQILLGFEGKAYHARDFYCSQILANILGGGMSSRLFQEVREIRGLCYSIYAFHWGFSDTGIFGIHAATGGENLPELVPVIIDELHKSASRSTRRKSSAPAPRSAPSC
jgi:predicted Zn-dependent peptidase